MKTLAMLVRGEVTCFLSILAALVVYQLLTGQIRTMDLLRIKTKNQWERDAALSAARIQLLVVTLLGAAFSLANALQTGETTLTLLPEEGLLAIGASQLLYLFSKHRAFRSKSQPPNSAEKG